MKTRHYPIIIADESFNANDTLQNLIDCYLDDNFNTHKDTADYKFVYQFRFTPLKEIEDYALNKLIALI